MENTCPQIDFSYEEVRVRNSLKILMEEQKGRDKNYHDKIENSLKHIKVLVPYKENNEEKKVEEFHMFIPKLDSDLESIKQELLKPVGVEIALEICTNFSAFCGREHSKSSLVEMARGLSRCSRPIIYKALISSVSSRSIILPNESRMEVKKVLKKAKEYKAGYSKVLIKDPKKYGQLEVVESPVASLLAVA